MAATEGDSQPAGNEAPAELRARANRARRLAREVGDDAAAAALRLLAGELEDQAEELETKRNRI